LFDSAEFQDKLTLLRKRSADFGKPSWTSAEYQRDMLEFILGNSREGQSIIEIGCYKGGLTAMLALACKEVGLTLDVIDIMPSSIESACTLLSELHLSDHVMFYRGTFPQYVSQRRPSTKAALCILDGDHAYPAVIEDLAAVDALPARPYALAFHDYSLRHPTTNERVSDAIRDHFGPSAAPRPIGLVMNGQGHATKEHPQEDGHYWEVPGSEGAILVL